MKKVFVFTFLIFASFGAIAQSGKRALPNPVTPVVYGALRLTAPQSQMGYVVAYDTLTGKEVWNVRIYKVHYKPFIEKAAQVKFINLLDLRKDVLLVRDEDGLHYILDLKTLAVTDL